MTNPASKQVCGGPIAYIVFRNHLHMEPPPSAAISPPSGVALAVALVLCFVFNISRAQFLSSDAFHKKAADSVRRYMTTQSFEKVYLHFDKTLYSAGDTCWYKAYVVNASDLQSSRVSGVVYVDWIDPKGNLLEHQQIKINDGKAQGDYTLSLNAAEGVYRVRAYTQWMQNDDPAFFFSTDLNVINLYLTESGKVTTSTAKSVIDLQFFPEGGAAVSGIESRIAFKATGPDGKGIDVEGKIVDEGNRRVTFFQSVRRGKKYFPKGMGIVTFTPQKGNTYTAVLPSGETFDLPPSEEEGYVMSAGNLNAETLLVKVQVSKNLQPADVYLVAQSRGRISFQQRFTINSTGYDIPLPKEIFETGVVQLTLFDSKGVPRCERMVFVNRQDHLFLTVTADKDSYGPREPVTLKVRTSDANGNPVETSMSLSVTDAGITTRSDYYENILTRLLLQSDMRGTIEDPSWYLESTEPQNAFGLDLVMLTNGWRKFDWERLLYEAKPPLRYPAEQGLTLKGQVTNDYKKPITRSQLMLLVNDDLYEGIYEAEADEDGNFTMFDVDFNDSTTLVWKVLNQKGKDAHAEISFMENEIPVIETPDTSTHSTTIAGTARSEYLENLITRFRESGEWDPGTARMLEAVEVEGNRITNNREIGFGRTLIVPTRDDLKLSSDQFISRQRSALRFLRPINMPNGDPPVWAAPGIGVVMIYIDGVLVEGIEPSENPYYKLNSVPIDWIENVVIYEPPMGGITIYITTRTIPQSFGPGKGVATMVARGYDVPRQFYQPKYPSQDSTNLAPDHRQTLHWEPVIQTDSNGEAVIRFYNSDGAKRFRVVVNGIANGTPGAVCTEIGTPTEK